MCIYIYIYFLVLLQKGPKKMMKKSASIVSKNIQKSYILSCHIPIPPLKTKSRTFSGSKTDTPKRVDGLSTSTKNSHQKPPAFFHTPPHLRISVFFNHGNIYSQLSVDDLQHPQVAGHQKEASLVDQNPPLQHLPQHEFESSRQLCRTKSVLGDPKKKWRVSHHISPRRSCWKKKHHIRDVRFESFGFWHLKFSEDLRCNAFSPVALQHTVVQLDVVAGWCGDGQIISRVLGRSVFRDAIKSYQIRVNSPYQGTFLPVGQVERASVPT